MCTQLPYEYVAIFDADFEMPYDWLFQTIWHLERDKNLGFVQTRWCFTNGYDNLLTWVQQVSLNFHFSVEQRARSFLRTFFGFNGTAGVWRRRYACVGWVVVRGLCASSHSVVIHLRVILVYPVLCSAMEEAGGWNMDSTVEDMDLSLRAYLKGWKFRWVLLQGKIRHWQ